MICLISLEARPNGPNAPQLSKQLQPLPHSIRRLPCPGSEGGGWVTCEALTMVLLTPYSEMERWRCRRLCWPFPLAFALAMFLFLLLLLLSMCCCWFWLLVALLLLSSWFWTRWPCWCLVGSMGLSGKFNSIGQVSRLSSMNVEFCCGSGAILSPGIETLIGTAMRRRAICDGYQTADS